jgi:F-type H+-transporting ATPase subunit delta
MKGTVLSRRYAEALADVAEEEDLLDLARRELNPLAEAFRTSPEFRVFARAAHLSRAEKQEAAQKLAERLGLCPPVRRLLSFLVQKKRLPILIDLAASYAEEADRRLGRADALLTTAAPLTEEQRRRIVGRLESVTGKQIRLAEQQDESIIAGFQVHLDGLFYDGSLRGQLNRIRETIAHGG